MPHVYSQNMGARSKWTPRRRYGPIRMMTGNITHTWPSSATHTRPFAQWLKLCNTNNTLPVHIEIGLALHAVRVTDRVCVGMLFGLFHHLNSYSFPDALHDNRDWLYVLYVRAYIMCQFGRLLPNWTLQVYCNTPPRVWDCCYLLMQLT